MDPWKDCTQVPGSYLDCLKRREPAVLQNHSGVARRRGRDLILRLANRDSVVLHDSIIDAPGAIEYWLQDRRDDPCYFMVGFHGYETRGSILISARNGWRREFPFNFPVFSSNGQLVALTIPVGTAYWDPAIDIYAISSDTLVQELPIDATSNPTLLIRGDTFGDRTIPGGMGKTCISLRNGPFFATSATISEVGRWSSPRSTAGGSYATRNDA
jgi:hypothetical protein